MEINRAEEFIKHYSSPDYDPVKAHEYYIKNRQLKGRSTSGMSDAQKEAWAYSKSQVTADKKKELEIAQLSNQQSIDTFQKSAAEVRARISDKLKLLSKQLANKAELEREQIADKLKADIANVAPIPKGVSAERRAILIERRNKEIDRIRNTASKHSSNLKSDTKKLKEEGSDDVSKEREQIKSDLKSVISSTRDEYKKEKAKLVSEYETIYQKEYDKVLSTIAGKPKKAKKDKAGSNKGIIYYNGKGPTR